MPETIPVRTEKTTRTKSKTIRILQAFAAASFIIFGSPISAQAAEGQIEGDVITVEPAPLLTFAELKQLVGPVALYPDDLLAIVLPASTYPLQVVAAARFRSDTANDAAEPNEDWDESIVALLNYPEALALLNDDIDWTWELGQAVADQEEDLMRAVQDVRKEAYAAGNIDSDDKQNVYVKNDVVVIEPADEEVVYVPYYEPEEVVRYQTTKVYHYYPTRYPLYYYPYHSSHYFYDYGFWGISSFYTLNWGHRHLRHYHHGHRHHRYYRHRYHDRHYRYTRHYRSKPIRYHRWAHRRAHNYAYNGHWRPKYRHYGDRPKHRKYRDRSYDRRYERRHDRKYDRKYDQRKHKRHFERRGRHHYAAIHQDRKAFRRAALTPREQRRAERALRFNERRGEGARARNPNRSSVHRDVRREQNAVSRRGPNDVRTQNRGREHFSSRTQQRADRPNRERRLERRSTQRPENRPNRVARQERQRVQRQTERRAERRHFENQRRSNREANRSNVREQRRSAERAPRRVERAAQRPQQRVNRAQRPERRVNRPQRPQQRAARPQRQEQRAARAQRQQQRSARAQRPQQRVARAQRPSQRAENRRTHPRAERNRAERRARSGDNGRHNNRRFQGR